MEHDESSSSHVGQAKKKATARSTQLSRDSIRQVNILWGSFLGHSCDVSDKVSHTRTVRLLQDRISSLTESWSSGSGSWLKTIPLLSFVIMQVIVLHCCIHFNIEKHETPPIILQTRAESHYERSETVIKKWLPLCVKSYALHVRGCWMPLIGGRGSWTGRTCHRERWKFSMKL